MYPIATGSGDQAIELLDIAGDDHQEIGEAEKANLVPASTATGEDGDNGSEEREKCTVANSGPQQEEAERAKDAQEAAVPEKLQDDDQIAEIWYKRWFFKLFPKLKRGVCVCVCVCVCVWISYRYDMEFSVQLRTEGGWELMMMNTTINSDMW